MVNYNDINIMYDMIQKFPNKRYIIRIRKNEEVNWEEIDSFKDKVDLIIAFEDMLTRNGCNIDVKYYFAYPATTWAEVRVLLDLGVSELFIGAPLTFDLIQLNQQAKVPIRMIANKCYDDNLPRENGICGSYVRPEDVDYYGTYVSTLEFDEPALSKEAVLLDIYQSGHWQGNLNLLLTNLNYNVDNRGIPEDFGPNRINCGQRCQRQGTCHYCETAFIFSRVIDKAVQASKQNNPIPEAEENSIDK